MLRSQSGRISLVTVRRSCHRSFVEGRHRCPSIRAKALSRTNLSWRCFKHRLVSPEKVEDQGSGTSRCNHFSVEIVPPTIDTALNIDHDSSMRTSRRRAGCESAQSIHRSSLRRPGAPAGCSRCERSPDTPSGYAASSRVVRPTCAPLPPWPRLSASGDSDANTVSEIRDQSAPQSAPLPPANCAAVGCPAW